MSEPEEQTYTREVAVNTAQHEQILSEAAKNMVGGILNLCTDSLNNCVQQMEESPKDPLSAEKHIHLADQLSLIAERMYDLGERSRERAEVLYNQGKKG